MTTLTEAATEFLQAEARQPLVDAVAEMIRTGEATWQWDPSHTSVAGLVHRDQGCAMVIYFGPRDFEVADWFEEML